MKNKITLECNRLVENPKYEEVKTFWEEKMGKPVPEDEQVERYEKYYFNIDVSTISLLSQDDENPNEWSYIMLEDMNYYLLDVHFKVVLEKIKQLPVVIITKEEDKGGEAE
jgi:hypothetical protein